MLTGWLVGQMVGRLDGRSVLAARLANWYEVGCSVGELVVRLIAQTERRAKRQRERVIEKERGNVIKMIYKFAIVRFQPLCSGQLFESLQPPSFQQSWRHRTQGRSRGHHLLRDRLRVLSLVVPLHPLLRAPSRCQRRRPRSTVTSIV